MEQAERDALALEVYSFKPKLMSLGRAFVRDYERLQDLVSDTMYAAIKYCHNYKQLEDNTMLIWLYKIMKNLYINQYRKIQKGSLNVDGCVTSEIEVLFERTGSKYNQFDDLQSNDILWALERVESNHREALEMLLDGASYEEMSDKWQVSIGTTKSRVFYARNSFRKILIKIGYDENEFKRFRSQAPDKVYGKSNKPYDAFFDFEKVMLGDLL